MLFQQNGLAYSGSTSNLTWAYVTWLQSINSLDFFDTSKAQSRNESRVTT